MAKAAEQERKNPECFGFSSDNVPGCRCKAIFEEKTSVAGFFARAHATAQRLDAEKL